MPNRRNANGIARKLRVQFLVAAGQLGLTPPFFTNSVIREAEAADNGAERVLGKWCDTLLDARKQKSIDGLFSDCPDTDRKFSHTTLNAASELLGKLCQGALGQDCKTTGTYYTPRRVADSVVRTALSGVLDGRGLAPEAALSLRILDPAAGAGAFLISVVDAIAEAMGEGEAENTVRRAVVRNCIRALEIDSLAAEACRLSLWLVASRPGRPAAVPEVAMSVRNTLLEPPRRHSFDIVVGNPPWGVSVTPEEAERVSRLAPEALQGHRDSFLFFLALAADAARDNGAVGLVLPDALLSQLKYGKMRGHLLARFRPLHIARLGAEAFSGATAPACSLCLIGKAIASDRYRLLDLRRPKTVTSEASPDSPLKAPHHSFLLQPARLDRLVKDLSGRHPTLGDLGQVFRFHDSGINYATAELGRAIIYIGARQHADDIPVTRGRDFTALSLPGSSAWLRHDWAERIAAGGISVRSEMYRIAPKLLLRQTGDRPVATVDRSGVHFGRSVIAVSGPSESDLLWLAAVMNSSAFACLYRALTAEVGRPFAQVKVNKLKLMPVPAPDGERDISRLAGELLGETKKERRAAMQAELDDRVAEAYGLSADQRRIVMEFAGGRAKK